MKVCNVCSKLLELDKFYKKRNGYEGSCKVCKNNKSKDRMAKDPTIYLRKLETQKRRIEQNPNLAEDLKKYYAAYYQLNREKRDKTNKDWYTNNPNKRLQVQQNWQRNNKGAVRFHANKRRVAKLRATPKWADTEWEEFVIQQIYELAALKQKMHNKEYHVDHIVPLQSRYVCGLHCASNLRVVLGKENLSKGNRYWPDMWAY